MQCDFENIKGCSCFTIAAISFVQLLPLCRFVFLLHVHWNCRSTEILCQKLSRCLNLFTNNVHSLNSLSNCPLDNIPDIRSRTVIYLLMFKRWYKITSGSLETEKWSVNAWGRHQLTVITGVVQKSVCFQHFRKYCDAKKRQSHLAPYSSFIFLLYRRSLQSGNLWTIFKQFLKN